MIYGYCRVSTKGQLENNSLDQQEQEILAKYENAKITKEQFSAKTMDRPQFNKLIEELKKGDMLVVTKLDRLARNAVEGIQIVEQLFEKGVSVHVLNVGLLENTTMGRFFLTTLLAVAEMERNMIIERTQAGKEIAKQRPDFREGRPRVHKRKQIEHALDLLYHHSYNEVVELTGISKSTLVRAVREKRAKVKVVSVEVLEDYRLLVEFSSQEQRNFDVKPLMEKPVFAALKDLELFKQVRVGSGGLIWNNSIDISSSHLYEHSQFIMKWKGMFD